ARPLGPEPTTTASYGRVTRGAEGPADEAGGGPDVFSGIMLSWWARPHGRGCASVGDAHPTGEESGDEYGRLAGRRFVRGLRGGGGGAAGGFLAGFFTAGPRSWGGGGGTG